MVQRHHPVQPYPQINTKNYLKKGKSFSGNYFQNYNVFQNKNLVKTGLKIYFPQLILSKTDKVDFPF